MYIHCSTHVWYMHFVWYLNTIFCQSYKVYCTYLVGVKVFLTGDAVSESSTSLLVPLVGVTGLTGDSTSLLIPIHTQK